MTQKFSLLVGAFFIAAMSLAPLGGVSASEEKPYFFEGNKIDFGSYNGYRRYHSECHVCHGPDANGSSFAPALRESLKVMDYGDFLEVVVNGRVNSSPGIDKVMPALGNNENVMFHLEDIYSYIKARSDGVLPAGRPPHLPKPKS